jgi:hypothetical protein
MDNLNFSLDFENINLDHFYLNNFLSDVIILNKKTGKEYKLVYIL